jgi:hypothetical protein
MDTIYDGLPLKQYFCGKGTGTLLLQRIKYHPADYGMNGYPDDPESLNGYYKKLADDFLTGLEEPGVRILDTRPIKIGKFDAYLMKAKKGKSKVIEGQILLLGDYVYFVNYINFTDFNEDDKNAFFGSVAISGSSPEQYKSSGDNSGFAIGRVLGVFLILGLFAGFIILIIYLVRKSRR